MLIVSAVAYPTPLLRDRSNKVRHKYIGTRLRVQGVPPNCLITENRSPKAPSSLLYAGLKSVLRSESNEALMQHADDSSHGHTSL